MRRSMKFNGKPAYPAETPARTDYLHYGPAIIGHDLWIDASGAPFDLKVLA